jgi:hypothetical protein
MQSIMKFDLNNLKTKFLILSMLTSSNTFSQVSLDVESGFFKVNQNDASSSWKNSQGELNGLDGTQFSYANDFSNPLKPLLRLRTSYSFGKNSNHFLSLLAAPLQYSSTGVFDRSIVFSSTTFQTGVPTEGFYKFNGYRLTYRYHFLNNEKIKFGIGLTINFRDAEFSLRQGEVYARNYNRGFVPLVNTFLNYQLKNKLGLMIDGDVFYIDNTGGAIDYLAGLSYKFSDSFNLKAGYRFFSGVGSEKGNVYNKLFVSAFSIGGIYSF